MTGGDGAQMQIAPMEPGDIPEALAIQSQAYPASLQEDAPVFAARGSPRLPSLTPPEPRVAL